MKKGLRVKCREFDAFPAHMAMRVRARDLRVIQYTTQRALRSDSKELTLAGAPQTPMGWTPNVGSDEALLH